MIERTGDLFTTDAFYIGHGVNCRGLMGAGIAKTVKEKFPETYRSYNRRCKVFGLNPGEAHLVIENGKGIFNLATQLEPGPNARYDWVLKSFLNAAARVSVYSSPKKIAIPQIGCGIGGLEWDNVKKLIEAVEVVYPEVVWETWTYA